MRRPWPTGAVEPWKKIRVNKVDSVHVTKHWGAFVQPLLQWKAVSITYSDCVSLAFGIQQAVRTRPIFICGLSYCTVFFHILSITAPFWGEKIIEHQVCVFVLSTTFVSNIPRYKKNWARYDQKSILVFMQSTRHSCHILRKLEFSRQIFEKYSDINFMITRPEGADLFSCGRTGRS